MGFESPRKSSIDDVLAKLDATTAPKSFETNIDGVDCKIFPTSDDTWNVYQDGVLYAVTKRNDDTFLCSMQSEHAPSPDAIEVGKRIAIKAVRTITA